MIGDDEYHIPAHVGTGFTKAEVVSNRMFITPSYYSHRILLQYIPFSRIDYIDEVHRSILQSPITR